MAEHPLGRQLGALERSPAESCALTHTLFIRGRTDDVESRADDANALHRHHHGGGYDRRAIRADTAAAAAGTGAQRDAQSLSNDGELADPCPEHEVGCGDWPDSRW